MSIPRMRPPDHAIAIDGEVPFHDCDPLQIVWHGHYFKYFEIARTALFVRHHIDGEDMLELGYRFVVSHSECRHVSPLTYRDRYRVKAWFLSDATHRVDVGYEVWNVAAERRAARARTEMVTTAPDGVMLLVTPDVIQARIRAALAASKRAR